MVATIADNQMNADSEYLEKAMKETPIQVLMDKIVVAPNIPHSEYCQPRIGISTFVL